MRIYISSFSLVFLFIRISLASSPSPVPEAPFSDRIYTQDGYLYRHVGRAAPLANLHTLEPEVTTDYIKPEDIYIRPHSTSTARQTTTLRPSNNEGFIPTSKSIPEDLLVSMESIKDMSDLLGYLEEENPNLTDWLSADDIKLSYLVRGDEYREGEPRGHTMDVPKITAPAGCTPELHSYVVDKRDRGADIYFPWCVKLPRCSGCCSSRRLICKPTSVSTVNITVLRLSYRASSKKFKLVGTEAITGQKHDKCRCVCLQTAEDCNEKQYYRADECRCVCKDMSQVFSCQYQENKYWDISTCSCKEWPRHGRTQQSLTTVLPIISTSTSLSPTFSLCSVSEI